VQEHNIWDIYEELSAVREEFECKVAFKFALATIYPTGVHRLIMFVCWGQVTEALHMSCIHGVQQPCCVTILSLI
jgi:hypothetical protein